jgi:hypothetical protein
MSIQAERDSIMESFTCAHIRLTRAISAAADGQYHWAPGCVHPRMHNLFDGTVDFCERCPCYMRRAVDRL